MTDKKTATTRIWQDRFGDSRQWMEMVHSRIYNDRDCLTIDVDGNIVSQLLLRNIDYLHLGQPLKATYIYGAATRRDCQHRGYMSKLMVKALRESFSRGASVAFLKPAQRWLYDFYAGFGFATTVYIDEQRYTSAHKFPSPTDQFAIETSVNDIDELARSYNNLASLRPSTSLHDQVDFMTIMIDNSLDDGVKAIVRNRVDGGICGIAFAVTDADGNVAVRDLVASDEISAELALGGIADQLPGRSMVVESPTCYRSAKYEARGMGRIINVAEFLRALVKVKPDLKLRLRIADPVIAENNNVFRVSNGEVIVEQIDKTVGNQRFDLDVDIEVFTSIVFSSPEIGSIFNLPAARSFISLMLD